MLRTKAPTEYRQGDGARCDRAAIQPGVEGGPELNEIERKHADRQMLWVTIPTALICRASCDQVDLQYHVAILPQKNYFFTSLNLGLLLGKAMSQQTSVTKKCRRNSFVFRPQVTLQLLLLLSLLRSAYIMIQRGPGEPVAIIREGGHQGHLRTEVVGMTPGEKRRATPQKCEK